MSRLYIDCEFNGIGGELISLALASPDGKHWYGIWPRLSEYTPWVEQNVAPVLAAMPPTVQLNRSAGHGWVEWRSTFRASLHEYLLAHSGCTIYADWPDDFAHLMRVMSGPSYEQSWIAPCTMVLLQESDPRPEHPHNALSDAIALMEWHEAQAQPQKGREG